MKKIKKNINSTKKTMWLGYASRAEVIIKASVTFFPYQSVITACVLTASCCYLAVLFCLSSEWHAQGRCKLNQMGTLCTQCVGVDVDTVKQPVAAAGENHHFGLKGYNVRKPKQTY